MNMGMYMYATAFCWLVGVFKLNYTSLLFGGQLPFEVFKLNLLLCASYLTWGAFRSLCCGFYRMLCCGLCDHTHLEWGSCYMVNGGELSY